MAEVRPSIPNGRILTLAPFYPLEAKLAIYPSFSTGPIAWRIAPFIEPAKAARLHILSPATLAAALEAKPPAGILVGVEKTGEDLLIGYAKAHGYKPLFLSHGDQLWIRRPE
jgi:hypothetical protein